MELTAAQFVEFARSEFLRLGWLKLSGAFLFSAPASIRPGDLLLIGMNPGGSVDIHNELTIECALAQFASRPSNWSAWWHEGNWGSTRIFREQGSAPLQQSVRQVLAALGYPGDFGVAVCSTELVFIRSQDISSLEENFEVLAEQGWAINAELLRIVRPRRVLLIGNGERHSPWSFFKQKFAATWRSECIVPYGRSQARLKAATLLFENSHQINVVAFPHLSRFGVPSDIEDRLAKLFGGVNANV